MNDNGPYSNYRLTVRLELANKPGMFAKVAAVLAEEGANLGAVDVVSATADCMVPDVTFDVQNEAHGEKVLARVRALPDVKVLSASDRIKNKIYSILGFYSISQYVHCNKHILAYQSSPHAPYQIFPCVGITKKLVPLRQTSVEAETHPGKVHVS